MTAPSGDLAATTTEPAAQATTTEPQSTTPTATQPTAFDPASLSPEAKAYLDGQVRKAQADADAKARTTSKANARQETLDEIAKALGLKPAELDPAKLSEQLTRTAAENRSLKIDAAIRTAAGAPAVRGDAELIGAVLDRAGRLADLDPAAADFADKVAKLVTDAVAANPRLKLDVPATAATQGAVAPVNGGQSGPRVADLNGAVAKLYSR